MRVLVDLLVVVFIIMIPASAIAHSYDFYTVDEDVNVGENATGISINSNGNPGICYYDSTNKILKFASFDGADWSLETADNDGGSGDVIGINCAITYDDNDDPNIVYFNTTDNEIRHAKKNGGLWEVSVVDDAIESDVLKYDISRISIARTSLGDIGIAYYDGGVDADLKYAIYDGADWNVQEVMSEGDVGRYPSLDYDSNDNPGIAYMNYADGSDAELYYIYYDGLDWQVEEMVDDSDYAGADKTLRFDHNDDPHIVYRQVDENSVEHLLHTKKIDGAWIDPISISDGSAEFADEGTFVQVDMDGEGNLFGVYRSYFRSALFGQNNFIRVNSYYFADNESAGKIQGETLTHTFGAMRGLSGMAIALDDNHNMAISWSGEKADGSFSLRAAVLSEWNAVISMLKPDDDDFEADDQFTLTWRDFSPDANADIQFVLQDAGLNETVVGSAEENGADTLEIDTSGVEPGEYSVIGRISIDSFQTNSSDVAPVLLEVLDHSVAADPAVDNPADAAAIDVDGDNSGAGQVVDGDSDDSGDSQDAEEIDPADLQALQNAAKAMGCSLVR